MGAEADRTGHVIVCGLNRVGVRTVEQLHLAGVPVVVVDDQPEPRYVRTVRAWNVPHLTGSSAADTGQAAETLQAAGLAGAAAVVCVQADDLQTLATALLARELRPGVRVVVQLSNPAVGRALGTVGVAVLDVAGLAAPSVVGPLLRTGVHHIDLGAERFLIADTTVAQPGALRGRYGDLAPVAVAPADGGDLVVCPSRDHTVEAGDTVTLIGTPDQLAAAGLTWRPERRRSRGGRPRQVLASVRAVADRRLRRLLAGVASLVALSTTVLWLGYREPDGTRMSVVDALYFTVETLATVGYGDFSFRQEPTWLRLFAIAVMIVGVVTVTVFFALLADLLVSRRIEESLGRGRVTGRSGHVIVVGLGSVGLRVTQQLRASGSDVVVVDRDETNRFVTQVKAMGIPVITADATLPDTLDAVNLAGASAVAILTGDDLVNLETGLAIRDQLGTSVDGGAEAGTVPVVLRLFDRQLARTVERNFDVGQVRSAAALAAPWFVGAALGLDVIGTFYVESTPMLVARLTAEPGGGLDGLAMSELSARIRVVAIARAADGDRLEHPPRRGTRFAAGDQAYLLGPYQELLSVLSRNTV